MSEEKICPIMTHEKLFDYGQTKQLEPVYCQKEKCMAWGCIGYEPSTKVNEYGCKLIEGGR